MKINRYFIASIASLAAVSAWADSAPKALNLNLPPSRLTSIESAKSPPAKDVANVAPMAVTAQSATSIRQATANATQPVAHYDATANAMVDAADSSSRKPACDDSTYGKPQVHGDVEAGVVSGKRVSGNYESSTLNITKAMGSCDHPTGGIGVSITVGRGDFNGRGYRGRHW